MLSRLIASSLPFIPRPIVYRVARRYVAGVTLRGLNVSSFDDWMSQAARREDQTLGLSTMFVPLFRIERIFLDEPVGEVESYRQRFLNRVGISVESYLGLEEEGEAEVPS